MCIKQDQTTSGGKDKHMHRQTDRQTDIPIYHTCGYSATPAKCRWAGPVLRLLDHLGRNSEAKECKNSNK